MKVAMAGSRSSQTLLEQDSAYDQDQAGQGGGQDRLAHQHPDEDQGEEGGEEDQIADPGGGAGQFQGLEPEQKRQPHFEQSGIDASQ